MFTPLTHAGGAVRHAHSALDIGPSVFVGGGAQVGLSGTKLPTKAGWSDSCGVEFDANLGAGESVGVSGVISADGAGIAGAPGIVGRAGFGYGMQAGAGPAVTKTWASPALRCAN